MAERNLVEQLDQAVNALLAGRPESATFDAELAGLLVIAADLRDVADPQFKSSLMAELIPQTEEDNMPATTTERSDVIPYFVVNGASEMITFLEEAFGAKEDARFKTPDGKIMHAAVRIGDSMLELGDASGQYPPMNFGIHLYVRDADAVYRSALRAGATSVREPADQFYGDREATVNDRWGNQWYIATHQAAGQPIRPGYRAVTPFLHPKGTDQLIEFVKQTFGAQTVEEPYKTPDGLIAHAAMRIGNALIEMGERHGEWAPMPANLHVFVDDVDATYARALRAGATSAREPADQPYGERVAGVVDPWGNNWWIAKPLKQSR
ncbi:MAG TPA: VOC family protein [Thermoanaerobaculia bacterium]|nr:VOC family protein [Thermoanaerobaculia bacterium]